MSDTEKLIWKILQIVLVAIGFGLIVLLLFVPSLGLKLFWNLLISVAPALLVVAPGLWRNICPLSSLATLPRKMGVSSKVSLSSQRRGLFTLIGIVFLIVIVALRHPLFNISGPATGTMLILAGLSALIVGFRYKGKSGCCNSFCPIYPVEKLYGIAPAVHFKNAHCSSCDICSTPCPDALVQGSEERHGRSKIEAFSAHLIIGGLAGYLFAWYQLPDAAQVGSAPEMLASLGLPLTGMATSLTVYLLLRHFLAEKHHLKLERIFTTAAISTYYWFRLPAMFGLGSASESGVLVDISHMVPQSLGLILPITTTAFFVWFLLIRVEQKRPWATRPPYSKNSKIISDAQMS